MTAETEPAKNSPTAPYRQSEELRRLLAREEGSRKWWVRLGIVVALAGGGFGYARWRKAHPPPRPPKHMTEEVSRGDVFESIQSTGSVQPVTQVQVGAQVSGRISKRYVDYNSLVKKGDLLAELDSTLYQAAVTANVAAVASAKATLEGAKASLDAAKTQFERSERLNKQGLASESDLTTARASYQSAVASAHGAEAGLTTAVAQLQQAQTNLQYCKIYAPIDGVVISRSIDVGQTVAASFQAPVLFTIAQDLREMLVLADVDEADLGRLSRAEKPEVDVQVEAFPGETFAGTLNEIRYSSTSTQGVVTYPAVIAVRNDALKLRPGMTATVSIKTSAARGALRVPNAALRFRPLPSVGSDGKPKANKPEPPPPHGKGKLYLPPGKDSDPAKPMLVDVGISDGQFTVVSGEGVSAGLKIVVDETDDSEKKPGGPRLF